MTATGTPPPDAWLDPLRFENVCFDTMIIRHLVHAGGGDVLKRAFPGRMFWPEAVASELHLQAEGLHGRRGVPNLSAFLATCGVSVLDLTEEEEQEAEDIRLEMFTRKAIKIDPLKNLGEAQCLLVCRRQPGYALVCHDNKARGSARAHNLKLFHMLDVLHLAVRLGLCKPARVWGLYVSAVQTGMYELTGFPVAGARDRFMFVASTMAALWQAEQRDAALPNGSAPSSSASALD